MGHTHYWWREPVLDAPRFIAAAEDCRSVMDAVKKRGIAITGPSGTGQAPRPSAAGVFLNGDPAYEAFEVGRISDGRLRKLGLRLLVFEFCKTRRLPYDLAVTACLLVLKYHLGRQFVVHTDGSAEDWAPAIELVAGLGIEATWVVKQTEDGRQVERAA